MIRIGISKEFSLDEALIMMKQLDQVFEKGIYTKFTDISVYFSIEIKFLLSVVLKDKYWRAPEFLVPYRWVLVSEEYQVISREFDLSCLFDMSSDGYLAIFPYIRDNSSSPIYYIPHITFIHTGKIKEVVPGKHNTKEKILERIQQMGLQGFSPKWKSLEDPVII